MQISSGMENSVLFAIFPPFSSAFSSVFCILFYTWIVFWPKLQVPLLFCTSEKTNEKQFFYYYKKKYEKSPQTAEKNNNFICSEYKITL